MDMQNRLIVIFVFVTLLQSSNYLKNHVSKNIAHILTTQRQRDINDKIVYLNSTQRLKKDLQQYLS